MSLSDDDVLHIANLSRLQVSPAEVAEVGRQLNGIFEMIEQLKAVNTEGVEPMSHAQDVMLRLRDDVVTESDSHEKFQAIAPAVEAGHYLVPQVIES